MTETALPSATGTAPDHRATLRPEVRGPDVGAMRLWLATEAVSPHGTVWSWQNPGRPGYAYPEAAGLWLTLASQHRAFDSAPRDTVAAALAESAKPSGAVGRDGVIYTFDTAMALHGLLAYEHAGGTLPDPRIVDRLFAFVAESIRSSRAVIGETPRRWSSSWTCHQLKLSLALAAYAEQREEARVARQLADRLAAELLPLRQGPRFVSDAETELTYLHAHCYAAEGLVGLLELGFDVRDELAESVDFLASVQGADGGLPSWHDGTRGTGPSCADVAAQAVRLFAALDTRRYAPHIARGLRFLRAAQAPGGGIRYAIGSGDVNTWCTVFADQAARWALEGRGGEWLS